MSAKTKKPYIYVASSWRNIHFDKVVEKLRASDFDMYNFRDPKAAFAWNHIDPYFQTWGMDEFRLALDHPLARAGFAADWNALVSAEALVLVNPCGNSAHLELGYAIGAGIPTVIYGMPTQAELMYKAAPIITDDLDEVVEHLSLKLK